MAESENRGGDKPVKNAGKFQKLGERLSRWLREMRSELKKVVWPTPKQVLNNTIIVIIVCVVIGVLIGVFDWITGSGVKALIQSVK